jgi:hypothetical protein
MTREHFEDVVNRGATGAVEADPALMVATVDLPTECLVIATRKAPAAGGREPHKKTEPAATTRATAGSISFWVFFQA